MIDEVMDQLTEPEGIKAEDEDNICLARDYFLNRLLIHSVSAIEYREKSELLDIDLEAECLLVVKLSYTDCSEQDQDIFEKRDRLFEIGKKFAESKSGYILFSAFGEITLILKGENENELLQNTIEELEKLLKQAGKAVPPAMVQQLNQALNKIPKP